MIWQTIDAILKSTLSRHLKLTLVAMANFEHAKNGKIVYPSVGTVAKLTSRQYDAAQRDMKKLERMGLLVRVRFRVGGVREFRINLDALPTEPPHGSGVEARSGSVVEVGTSSGVEVGTGSGQVASEAASTRIASRVDAESVPASAPTELERELEREPESVRAAGVPPAAADGEDICADTYVAIGKEALHLANLECTNDAADVRAHFEAECRRRGVPFNQGRADAAVGHAVAARDQAKNILVRALRTARR